MRIPSAYRHDFAGDLELLSEGMIVTLVSILLVSWFGELGATPREDQTPTFRAESDLVLVDLVVTDRSGQFVDDLNLEEVQVLEDGKVQDIRFFRLERTRAAELNPGPDEIPEPSRDPEGRKATAATAGGYYLFLLDLQTMDHNSVERSKESIREFLRSKIDPRDQTMLATIRPQFRVDQPMTQDFSKLEAALDRISYRHEKASLERFAERVDHIFSTGGPSPELAVSMAIMEAQQFLGDLAMRLDLSCRALSALSRYLGSLPGRKHVLYFSRGYPLNAALRVGEIIERRSKMSIRGMPASRGRNTIGQYLSGTGGSLSRLTKKLRSAVDQANRNQVSVYSIDPRGLMVVPFDLSGFYDVGDMEAPQEFLATLSDDTGGLLFTNENDLGNPMREAYLDSRVYYLLGYIPTTKRKPGKFHEIKVNLNRKGLKIRYRKGYADRDPAESATTDLANAFKFPDLYEDFPFEVSIDTTSRRLVVRAVISTKDLSFISADVRSRCYLDIFGIPFDDDGQPIGEGFLFSKTVELDFNEKELETFRKDYAIIGPSVEEELPEGSKDLIVVLRQRLSGRLSAGTYRVPSD